MSKANFSMLSSLHTTKDIAEFLGTTSNHIVYYIKAGYLKATMVKNRYLITYKDYIKFCDDYYYPEQRNKQRGQKTLTQEAVNLLKSVVKDLEDDSITLKEFKDKYPNIYLLPHPKIYLRFKRDKMIKADRSKGIKIKELAKKYALSIPRINKILEKEVGEFN